ncbi:hypothetical protein RRV45_13420 [Bacillus sp. DTU_2020_1000418_1_SI_GHA_SEK_038]|uniref:hypothetical protein n=1 Tax=Bacillus sp. DTU_2020_1000418_1_SI_GHA_SEK_038 TaxID=3077585 RepID=UPI0028F0CB4A|nr:hypothetical protein [Bacillus sp. DTU_2020_1000418_1_SI_GHA_SEK_038]WNS73917.1 hypothetical protein RRV45_13420 [Bacillus sp. DTU_2020_1000418_1_SI_GHA_SEK_038]
MRFLFRKAKYHLQESDLQSVEAILGSGYFILVDLFFWSLLITFLTMSLHFSFLWGSIIFVASYLFGGGLFFILRKWLGE